MAEVLELKGMKRGDWEHVAAALEAGGLVCLPTDTVYGLACLPAAAGALPRVYTAKGRDFQRPVALVFSSVPEVFDHLPGVPESIRKLTATLLPGHVTLVVPAGEAEKAALGMYGTGMAAAEGIGVRVIPPPYGKIFSALPGPLALTSANQTGRPDPCTVDEIPPAVKEACDFILDAGRTPLCLPSTVVDLRPVASGATAVILREGAVAASDIFRQIDGCGC